MGDARWGSPNAYDALAFTWIVSQDATSATYTTSTNFLEITQTQEGNPVGVSVAVLCLEDGQTSISDATLTNFSNTVNVDLSINGVLGEVGLLSVFEECASGYYEDPFGNAEPGNNNSSDCTSCQCINVVTSFDWISSNDGSGNIEYSYTLSPSSIGTDVSAINSSTGVDILWTETGSGSITVTATNVCTGNTTSKTATFYVDAN